MSAATKWWSNTIRIRRVPGSIRGLGVCCDKYWVNWRVVTSGMKVLQVERVVPGLMVVGEAELTFTALKFNWKDCWSADQYGVDSATEARNVKF